MERVIITGQSSRQWRQCDTLDSRSAGEWSWYWKKIKDKMISLKSKNAYLLQNCKVDEVDEAVTEI